MTGNTTRRDDRSEPALEFALEFDGEELPISPDRPVELKRGEATFSLTLRLKPTRLFDHGGLQFRYPREYTFKANTDTPSLKSWVLSGSDNTLMIFQYAGTSDHSQLREQVIESLVARYEEKNVKWSELALPTACCELKGCRLHITLAGRAIRQDVYSFSDRNSSYALVIQDTPAADGKASPETLRAVELIGKSLRFSSK